MCLGWVVQVEVGAPDPASPDSGKLAVTVECSACASPDYEVPAYRVSVFCEKGCRR